MLSTLNESVHRIFDTQEDLDFELLRNGIERSITEICERGYDFILTNEPSFVFVSYTESNEFKYKSFMAKNDADLAPMKEFKEQLEALLEEKSI